jgi:hypothetical protein
MIYNLSDATADIIRYNYLDDICKKEDLTNEEILTYIDNLDKYITDIDIVEEGLIGNTIKGIINLILRLLNNLKTMLLIFKSVKRSELKAYKESNFFTIRDVNKLNYSKVANVKIYGPPYKVKPNEMTLFLQQQYKMFDPKKKLPIIKENFNDLCNMLTSEADRELLILSKKINDFINIKKIREIIKIIPVKYTNQVNYTIEFGSLFNSMVEFKGNTNYILEMSNIVNTAKPCYNESNRLYNKVGQTLSNLSGIDSNNKKVISMLKEFSSLVFNIGKYFEGHGHILSRYHQTEHHIVVMYKELKKLRD